MPLTIVRHLGIVLLVAAALPARLAGQADPRLVAAVRTAQEGQSDSARAAVQQLLAMTPTTDTLYPQMLYTAGIIAGDAGEMRRRFQQVTVEHPTSLWTDDALLRLAQLDYASRQLDAAARSLERIAVDFPGSDLFPQAAYWAGRVYFELNKQTEACRWLADGIARSREDVEIQTQLGYLYQRCGAATASGDSTPLAPATPPPSTPAPQSTAPVKPAGSRYQVQIAAVGTAAAAEAAAHKAQTLGYRIVTVQEGELYKVRAKDFPTRAEAQRAAAEIKAKLGGNPFIIARD